MVFHLDTDLPRELAPLAWMIGRWEGAGVVGYPTIESKNFGQEIECVHDGRPFLSWRSRTWLLDDEGNQVKPLATETGFWRPLPDGEVELLLAAAAVLGDLVDRHLGGPLLAQLLEGGHGVIRQPGVVFSLQDHNRGLGRSQPFAFYIIDQTIFSSHL